MDILKYKTVIGHNGSSTVGVGLNHAQILKISRQGEQKDDAGFVSLSSLNGSNWSFLTTGKRVAFGSSFPFMGDEVIHIIYKVTT